MDLAQKLGFKYYTFISQVENGFGRVPSESMEGWAAAIGVPAPEFARTLLSFYDFLCWANVYERRVAASSVVTDPPRR